VEGRISRTVTIRADPTAVWRALTDPVLVRQWAAEPELNLEVVTDWQVGSPIVVKGFHHGRFENRGTVLHFQPNALLQYTHLSSISRLPDRPENYTRIAFRLSPSDDGATSLNVELTNFPTESILRHFDFYWRVTIEVLKRFVETSVSSARR
jgi:uncharacterized protein YndB with AHSA1/START domain